ncbi:MAG: SpoIID/LytB domain-containing protein [Synergistaceae bacterium]|nr:SpoIID/LytB domain-containing protein [Synergistaceae bacterium]
MKNPVPAKLRFPCVILVLSIYLAICGLAASKTEAAQNFNVKIGVSDGVANGKVSGDGIVFTDAKGLKGSVRNGAAISASGGGISVGGRTLALPVTATAKSGLGWNGVKYRGRLIFIRGAKGFTVVNELDLENYVRGILKMEMGADWPFEALKAQAILARTFAVRNRGRFSKRGYDFDVGENSQVYRGVNSEDPRTDKAVSSTTGLILTWNGEPAEVFYHSDSGGATADVSHVWGSGRPYLLARPEAVNYTSPNSTWQLTLSNAQLTSIFSKMGHNVGSVTALEVAQIDDMGRAVTLKATGDRGAASMKAHDFRMAAGSRVVKSTFFTVTRAGSGQSTAPPQPGATPQVPTPQPAQTPPKPASGPRVDPLIEMIDAGVFTTKEIMEMLMDPSKKEEYLQMGYERMKNKQGSTKAETPKAATPPPVVVPLVQTGNGNFIFNGKGWGHGVGLSQWGAKAMADQGMKCEEILAHYFPGTNIGK